MFCSYCGKTLLNNPQTCPYCHMPVGESHFDGSRYTSAQPRMRPGQEAPRPAPRRYTPPAYSPDEELYSRTGYRASEPEETEETPQQAIHEETQAAEERVDELLEQEPATDMDEFKPRPIEVTEQAGISPDVSEIISRMEAEPQRRFSRRRKADYDDYENAVEEETPTATTGLSASGDQEEVFEDIDDEEMDELRHSGFGLKQVLRIAVVLAVAAAVFVGVVSGVRYMRSNQSNAPIENVREDIYNQGVEMIKQHASDENRTEVLNAYTSAGNSLTALMAELDKDSAAITALLPDDATDNEKLFGDALTKIEGNIANCITSDALALSTKDETAVAESNQRWQVVDNSIAMLEAAKSATELTAIINGEKVDVKQAEPEVTPTPTPAPNYNTLSKGDKSNEVLDMQNRLWELGFLLDDRDGNFGSKTQTAVKMFQQAAGLSITGIADGETLARLYADDAPRTAMAQATPGPAAQDTPAPEVTDEPAATE